MKHIAEEDFKNDEYFSQHEREGRPASCVAGPTVGGAMGGGRGVKNAKQPSNHPNNTERLRVTDGGARVLIIRRVRGVGGVQDIGIHVESADPPG